MIWQDAINASYEFFGGLLMWFNVRQLYKDKEVKGVTLTAAGVFATWSWWNLYYYYFLNQHVSWTAGFVIGSANLTWVIMAIYYTRKKK